MGENLHGMWFTEDAYVDFDSSNVIFPDSKRKPISIKGNISFKLLRKFAVNAGHRITADALIEYAWGINARIDIGDANYDNNLHNQISKIRRLIGDVKLTPKSYKYIQTISGDKLTYIFRPPAQKKAPVYNINQDILEIDENKTFSAERKEIQENLIYGIKVLTDTFVKQMTAYINKDKNCPHGGATFGEMGKYIYEFQLESSLAVIESMLDLLLLENLNESEKKNISDIYMKIGTFYGGMASVSGGEKSMELKKISIHKISISARLGNPTAMQNLGFFFLRGIGVEKSLEIAKYWYQKAIDLGNKPAEYQMKLYFPSGD